MRDWIRMAIALDGGRHAVDEGKLVDGAVAGQDLKEAFAVYIETGGDRDTYPHLQAWLDPAQFGSDDEVEWVPEYITTKKEPWYRSDPKKDEWNGSLVPPAREICKMFGNQVLVLSPEDADCQPVQLIHMPIPDSHWSDELLARPFMLVS
jgi:hypothetical protein